MEATKYLKEKSRMTNNCMIKCSECPLDSHNNAKNKSCVNIEGKFPQEAIKIVQEWSEKHPLKTRKDRLLEVFPKTKMNEFGLPNGICCLNLGYDDCEEHRGDCISCWNEPYEE